MPRFKITYTFSYEPEREDYVGAHSWDAVSLEDALALDLKNMRQAPLLYLSEGRHIEVDGEVEG